MIAKPPIRGHQDLAAGGHEITQSLLNTAEAVEYIGTHWR